MQFVQQIEIHIRHQDHFRIRGRLRPFPVCRESKITRGEDTGLRILDIHVMDTGQVTDTTGYDDKAFVFDRTCLRTNTDTRIGVLRIGKAVVFGKCRKLLVDYRLVTVAAGLCRFEVVWYDRHWKHAVKMKCVLTRLNQVLP